MHTFIIQVYKIFGKGWAINLYFDVVHDNSTDILNQWIIFKQTFLKAEFGTVYRYERGWSNREKMKLITKWRQL